MRKEKRKTTIIPLWPFHLLFLLSYFFLPALPVPSVSPVLRFYLPIFPKPFSSFLFSFLSSHSPYSCDYPPPLDPNYPPIFQNPSSTPSSTRPFSLPTLPTTPRYGSSLSDPHC